MKNPKLDLANVITLLFLFGAMGLAACGGSFGGSDGGSAATPTPVTVWDQCGGCGGLNGGSVILDNVQAQTPDTAVSFWFNVVGAPGANMIGPKAAVFYAGPASISGVMRVNRASSTWCMMPPGDYQIQPLQPSNFSSGIMSGGSFQAIAPNGFAVYFRMNSSVFYNPMGGLSLGSPGNRANLNLLLDSVGGYSCGMMATN